jgi:hypothetical protein
MILQRSPTLSPQSADVKAITPRASMPERQWSLKYSASVQAADSHPAFFTSEIGILVLGKS